MLSLYVEKHGRDWNHYLPYLLYAYRVSAQESVCESPFFLLYGCDPRQLIDEALSCPSAPYVVDTDDYKSELVHGLSDAWKVAAQCIQTAQGRQKTAYDLRAKKLNYRICDRVMVHMPHESTRKAAKLARQFFGPFQILRSDLSTGPMNLQIYVSLSCIRPFYGEIPNVSWSDHT